MKIAIVGAGAIGSVLATMLQDAGEEVTMLVRDSTVPEGGSIRLQYEDAASTTSHWAIVPVVGRLAEEPDLVILAVKTHDISAAATAIAPYINRAPVLTTQIGPRGDILAGVVVGNDRIISGIPWFDAILVEPGHARILGTPNLYIGYAPEHLVNDTLRAIAAALNRALPTTITPHVANFRWARLTLTIPHAISAATNMPLTELMQDNRVFHIALTMMREATKVLEVAQISLMSSGQNNNLQKLQRLHAMPSFFAARFLRSIHLLSEDADENRSPTLQSLLRKRLSEIDYLNGEIVRLGSEYAIPTPANSRIVTLIHAIEQTGAFVSPKELVKVV